MYAPLAFGCAARGRSMNHDFAIADRYGTPVEHPQFA
jgi:hypothetical protein